VWEGDVERRLAPPWTELSRLAELDEPTLRAACRRRRYERNEVVFHEGDPAGVMHLIDRGRVAVRLTTPRGDVATIDILQRGDTFGEQALVSPAEPRTATVKALEKVETLTIDAATCADLCRGRTATGIDRFLLLVISSRMQATSQQLLEALYLPAETRVLRCLCRLSAIWSDGATLSVPMSQDDIATMTGVTRPTVSRMMRQLQVDGVLAVSRARIEVLKPDALRHKAKLRPAISARLT
jgi:CRP/FNR family transcriptional regulator, cyclic AMP receptor protein